MVRPQVKAAFNFFKSEVPITFFFQILFFYNHDNQNLLLLLNFAKDKTDFLFPFRIP